MSSTTKQPLQTGMGKVTLALVYLGLLASIQGADPNIASTALLSAGKDLQFGGLDALAASVSTLALAATVITTGMIADRLGRKKIIFIALLLAVLGDGLVSVSQDPVMYIVGRAIAGVAMGGIYGAAFAYVKYFSDLSRGGLSSALGIFSASIGFFTLVITFAGSALVGAGWREAFLVIPALSVLSLLMGIFVLPKDPQFVKNDEPWDALGQLILGFGVVFTLYGISHAADGLTSIFTIGPVVVGVVLFVLFFFREKSAPEKRFFPIALLKQPLFLAAIGAGFLYNFSTGFGLLSFSNLFQYQLDLKGLDLSLSQLPYLLGVIPTALLVGALVSRKVITRQMSTLIGAFIAAAGGVMFAVTALSSPMTVMEYLPALIVLGIGAAVPSIAYGSMILEEADPKHYGVVSSSRSTIGQFWYSLGLASSAVVIDSIARAHVLSKLGSTGEQQIDAWSASGAKPTNTAVFPTAIEGFTQGFAVLMIAYAVAMLVVGFLVLVLGNKSDKQKAASTPA